MSVQEWWIAVPHWSDISLCQNFPEIRWIDFLRDSKITNNRGRTAEEIRLVSKFKVSILPN